MMGPRARRIVHHFFVRPWPVLLMVGGIVIAISIGAVFGNTTVERVAWAGAVLEIAGLGKVAWDLHKLRKDFERPSVVAAVKAWFLDLPSVFHQPQPRTISLAGSAMLVMGGHATLTVKAGPGAPLERRVELLEREVEQLRDQVDHARSEAEARLGQLENSIASERADRTSGDYALRQKVADLAVGGLQLELVGLVWLFVGVALTTLPEPVVTALWERGATILRAIV